MRDRTLAEREDYVRFIAIAGLVCTVLFLTIFAARAHGKWPLPIDAQNVPLGRDFVNTWFYGRAFFDRDPGRLYDRTVYEPLVQATLPQNTVRHMWSYPPPFLLLAAPFGRLPYPVALAVWTVMGLVALGLTVRARGSAWLALAVLTAPITIFGILAGQVSLFLAALMILVFAQLDRRPVIAGLLLSLCILKPQTAVLLPVLLVASRRWAVLGSAALGAAAIVSLSVAVNGLDVWTYYVRVGMPAQAAELKGTMELLMPFSPTVTTEAFQASFSPGVVTLLQVLATLLAIGLVAFIGWRGKAHGRPNPDYEGLVALTCSILATPYFLIHDLVALSAMLLIVTYREGLIRNRAALLVILYVPILQIALAEVYIHVTALLTLALALWLVWRGGDGREPKVSSLTPSAWTEAAASP